MHSSYNKSLLCYFYFLMYLFHRIFFIIVNRSNFRFSLSVCRKQTEVCRFRFPFATNKRKLPFSVSSVFRIYIYIQYILKRQHIYKYIHRWAHLLIQQTSITFYRLPTNENKLPYSVVQIYIYTVYILKRQHIFEMYRYICIAISISLNVYSAVSNGTRRTKAQMIFLNPFTVCSSCKRKFVVYRLFSKKPAKLSDCKRIKRTCLSMYLYMYKNITISCTDRVSCLMNFFSLFTSLNM
jgi:hypothetical protein